MNTNIHIVTFIEAMAILLSHWVWVRSGVGSFEKKAACIFLYALSSALILIKSNETTHILPSLWYKYISVNFI